MATALDSAAALFDSTIAIRALAGMALRATLLLGLSSLLIAGIRPSSAIRHLLRTLALVLVLLLPLIQLAFPPWQADLLPEKWQARLRTIQPSPPQPRQLAPMPRVVAFSQPVPELSVPEAPVKAAFALRGSPTLTSSQPRQGVFQSWWRNGIGLLLEHWTLLLLVVWSGGFLYLSGRLLFSLACVQFAVRRAREVPSGHWRDTFVRIAGRLRIDRKARLLVCPKVEVALSVGVIRPAILLPEVARTWTQQHLESILLHELAHVKRWDNLSNVVSQWACAFYWYNPLVWWTAGKLKVERERACDDQVLATGTRASEYVGHLLEVARAVSSRKFWGQLEVSQSSALKDRLTAALNPKQDRRLPDMQMRMAAFLVAATVIFPVATFQPWVAYRTANPALDGVNGLSRLADGHLQTRALGIANTVPTPFDEESRPRNTATRNDLGAKDPGDRGGSATKPAKRAESRSITREGSFTPTLVVNVERAAAGRRARELEGLKSDPGVPFGQSRIEQTRRAIQGNSPSLRFASRSSQQAVSPGTVTDLLGELDVVDLGPEHRPEVRATVERIELGSLGLGQSRANDVNDQGLVVGESQVSSGLSHPFLWSKKSGIQDLGNPRGVHTRAVSINDLGQVLCATFDSNLIMGFFWSEDEGLRELGSLDPGFPVTVPKAMNSQGYVVGSSRAPDGTLHAFLWTPQEGLRDLDLPGWSEALAINDDSQIVGHSDGRAFVWDPEAGFEFLLEDSIPLSIATDLNSAGAVVGYAEFAPGIPQAFYWSRLGGLVNLGALSLDFPISLALGINDQSHIVGQSLGLLAAGSQRQARGFRWTPESGMEDIGVALPDAPLAINAVGHIIGTYGQTTLDTRPLALWLGVGPIELEDDVELFRDSEVAAVNNRGQIVGSSLSGKLVRQAILWDVRLESVETAVPNPGN